jgi:MoxR-like ATPase
MVDAYYAIYSHRKVLIKGQPGAGKSTLLKHIAFSFAAGISSKVPPNLVPILFELHPECRASKFFECKD